MESNNVFMYMSVVEGVMIVCMLGWEIFWLRRMYFVLWNMPTAKQLGEMIEMIKSDRDSIKLSLAALVGAFDPLKNMFSGLAGIGSIGSMFTGQNQKVDKE